ncbi:MAG: M23 family peptidase, partial [Bacteroidaceae bacterium]|nr:M23 family peptidase [Bacteroidaceae bacterium]
MRKVYYIYNPKTRTYDRIYPTVRQRALSIMRRLFVGMGLGAGSFILLLFIFGSPSEKELRIENSRLIAQYHVLSRRLDEALGVMKGIQQRDDNLYRVVLQTDPVSDAVRQAGYGGTNRYEELMDMANSELVINTTQKMDMLNRQLYIQSQSFDEVVELCKNHDEMLGCIPAIQPVSNKNLKQTASGYGLRIDPIYKTTKFHEGMDFSANIGTPVYATGNG